MEHSEDCLTDCGLADLGFSGHPFTWDNKREGAENIHVRLDRATCNGDFAQLFPATEVMHVMTEESYHQALVIKALKTTGDKGERGQRPFMYEAAWVRHEQYETMVAAAWEEAHAANHGGGRLATTCNSLRAATRSMQEWSRRVFGSIRKQIGHLKVQLIEEKERATRTGYRQEIKEIEDQLHELYEREEVFYKQRLRVDWLQERDQNTNYFQNHASHRKRKNTVKALRREDGSKCSDDEGMRRMAAQFYAHLFASEGSRDGENVLQHIEESVTEAMNAKLDAPFTDAEIEAALFQMGPMKAPGPDGLPTMFYQHHRALVKDDVCAAVREFLAGTAAPDGFNDTIIVMILKVKSPELLAQFM
ncbi:uncharacterized protein [Aegilops tauschii subsp. strangulata]|uniref:uncharacterized protein n=1 Tax=Aegilops tauschii subsp. strangulata TaxID=200361 RepID=UPI003CC86B20